MSNFKKYENTIDSETESIFFRNMLSALKMKVQVSAKSLRAEQKIHYQRLNDFGANVEKPDFFGEDDGKMPDYLKETKTSTQTSATIHAQIDEDDQTEEIHRVVESIKTLTTLLSQMNDVVIEQGTIVDRIDYNLEQAAKHVKKGNKELKEVGVYNHRQRKQQKVALLLVA